MDYDNELYMKLNGYFKNHVPIDDDEENINAFKLNAGIDVETIINNDGDFFSTTMTRCKESDEGYIKTKFSRQKIITSLLPPNLPIENDEISSIPQEYPDNQNEDMHINGFITTPYDLFKYSKIYSKNINLFEKAVLSSININNYVLNPTRNNYTNSQDCDYDTEIIEKDKIELGDDEDVLDTKFCSYLYSKEKDANEFLNEIIPNIKESLKIAFKLEKNKNKNEYVNNVSIYRLTKLLSPFLIDEHNLTKESYNNITKMLSKRVNKFKIKLKNMGKTIENYKKYLEKLDESEKTINNKLSLQIKKQTYKNKENLTTFTESELLQYILNSDQGNLYRIALKIEENNNLIPQISKDGIDIQKLRKQISDYTQNLNDEKEALNQGVNECTIKYTLAKDYYDYEELEKDNGKNIYYDKKYDDTPYYFLNNDEVKKAVDKITILFDILKKHYEEKSNEEINLIVGDILNHKKLVRENDVAFILNMEGDLTKEYYIRTEANEWELLPEKQEDFECLLKNPNTCISIKNKCESKDMNKLYIEEVFLNEMKDKYIEEVYNSKQNDMLNYKNLNIKNYINEVIFELSENSSARKDFEMGQEYKVKNNPVSQYTELLNTILSQNELDRKYKNIKIFKDLYCRNSYREENNHFYYCKESDKPLMPKFYYELANAYFNDNNYEFKIKEIYKNYGKEEGIYIIDKFSGYIIENRQYEKTVEFDQNNRVIKTGSIIEDNEIEEQITELKYRIQNYIINLNTALQLEEIDNGLIVDLINDIMEKEYKIIYKSLFYTTIAVYFIALQCLLNKKQSSRIKTYKGCAMSKLMVGYPINIISEKKLKDPKINEYGIDAMCCFIRQFFGSGKVLYLKNIITKEEHRNSKKELKKYKDKKEGIRNAIKILDNSIKNNLKFYIEKVLLNDNIKKFIKKNKKNISKEELKDGLLDIKEEIWYEFLPTLKYNRYGINGNSRERHYQLLDKIIETKGDKHIENIENNTNISAFRQDIIDIINKKISNTLDLIIIEQRYNTLKTQFILNFLLNLSINKFNLLLTHKNNFILENSCCLSKNTKYTHIINFIKYFNKVSPKDFETLLDNFNNKSIFYQNLIDYYSIKNTQLIANNNTKVKYNVVLNEDFSSEIIMLEYILENWELPEILNIKNKEIIYEKKLEHLKEYIHDVLPIGIKKIFEEILHNKSEKNALLAPWKQKEAPAAAADDDDFGYVYSYEDLNEKYKNLFDGHEDSLESVIKNQKDLDEYDKMNLIEVLIEYLANPNSPDIVEKVSKYIRKRIVKVKSLLRTTYRYDNIEINLQKTRAFEKLGEDLYISRDVETYAYKNQFLKRCCLDFAKVYPQLVIKSHIFEKDEQDRLGIFVDHKKFRSYVEHWNLADYHYKKIEYKIVNAELYVLVKDDGKKVLFNNRTKLEVSLIRTYLNVFYNIVDLLPILVNSSNLSLMSNIYNLIFMIIILIYFKYDEEGNHELTGDLIDRYFRAIDKRKNILNISDITLKNNIEKLKEMEKDDLTKKFRGMSADQRRVENLFKELQLEHWNVAQTKHLYKYDKYEHQARMEEIELKKLQEYNMKNLGNEETKQRENELTKKIIADSRKMNIDDSETRQRNEEIDQGIRDHDASGEQTQSEIDQSILDNGQDSLFDQEEMA